MRIDNDTNLFTDADLSILGKSWDAYSQYYQQVRKEYGFYPDLLYKPGRKKVLQHFLSMNSIYKTPFFKEKYEHSAIENLKHELTKL
jgi:predicted metal-dependent HD superfamily phosphohydrolase